MQMQVSEIELSSQKFVEGNIYDLSMKDGTCCSTISGTRLEHMSVPHKYRSQNLV